LGRVQICQIHLKLPNLERVKNEISQPLSLTLLLLLSACGGGGDGPGITVTGIQADRLSYGQRSQFKITGSGLDTNITVNTQSARPGRCCRAASATEQTVACTPLPQGRRVAL
jgi:hypothetical protein